LTVKSLSLIDYGANGGVAGEDVHVIFQTPCTFYIKGIDNHHVKCQYVNDIGIGMVGGIVQNQRCPVIAIMHQMRNLGPHLMSSSRVSMNGTPIAWTMKSMMSLNRETTLLLQLGSFMMRPMMNLVNIVIMSMLNIFISPV
jgi:hypothetical protein